MPSCIYLLTNLVNQKQYVGFATDFNIRMGQHKNAARSGRGKSHLYKSIRKYGWENFSKEIIYMSDDTFYCKNEAEVALIDSYNTYHGIGYNLTEGGDGIIGYKHSEETKNKMSIAHKGRKGGKRSNETKSKISNSSKGRFFSTETRHKLSISNTIHKMPDKQELEDLLKFCYQYEIAELYKCSLRTVCKWKSNLKL